MDKCCRFVCSNIVGSYDPIAACHWIEGHLLFKISIGDQLRAFYYFAGHDTTAILIAWCTWFLSQHDNVLKKVTEELEEHGIWNEYAPTYEDLQKCTYLNAVLKETLRLYPPAGGVARYHPNVDESFKGYTMGGATIILAIHVM
jgi:cytochrome P450